MASGWKDKGNGPQEENRRFRNLGTVRIMVGSGCRVKTAPGDAGAQNGNEHTGLSQKIQCPESLELMWQKVGSHGMSGAGPGLTGFHGYAYVQSLSDF